MLLQHTGDILFDEIMGKGGNLGLITLNRPSTLNALTFEMCQAINDKLLEWQHAADIKAVVIRGEGEKAFCAGGDIRYVYDRGRSGAKKSRKFFWHEYRMNRSIFHFTKPYIALMHGITMGGGVGLSVHGTHRVAAEDLVFAMPETGIGFFPDVGSSYFLPRCTGKVGTYMALTGARLHIADTIYAGVVDHLVPKKDFSVLISALVETKFTNDNVHMQVSDIINEFSMDVESMDIYKPHLLEHRTEINNCFAHASIEEIFTALQELDSEWCQKIVTKLLEKSPTSLKVTLKQLLCGVQMDFDECMQMEYRLVAHFLRSHDFYQGIRSVIIDKNHRPVWRPRDLEKVTEEMVNNFFAPLEKELSFEQNLDSVRPDLVDY
jgi:enoyl-CoA hydratase